MKQKYSKNTTVRDDIRNQRDFVDSPEGHSGSFSEDNNIKITSALLEELFHSATKQRKAGKSESGPSYRSRPVWLCS